MVQLTKRMSKFMPKKFYEMTPGVDLITLLGLFYLIFVESYIFSQHRKIMVTLLQCSSLQKSGSKFMAEKFYEIEP